MSPEERAIYSALLTQRWMLITNGVSRANIRIQGKSLYVHNKKHGTIIDSVLVSVPTVDTLPHHWKVRGLYSPRQRRV